MTGAKQKLEEFRTERIKYVADVLDVRSLGHCMVILTELPTVMLANFSTQRNAQNGIKGILPSALETCTTR